MLVLCQKDVTFGGIKTFSGTITEQVIGVYRDSMFVNQVYIEAALTIELHNWNKLLNHKRIVKHCTNISFLPYQYWQLRLKYYFRNGH